MINNTSPLESLMRLYFQQVLGRRVDIEDRALGVDQFVIHVHQSLPGELKRLFVETVSAAAFEGREMPCVHPMTFRKNITRSVSSKPSARCMA